MTKNRNYPEYEVPQIKYLCEMILMKSQTQPDDTAFAWFENSDEKRVTYREFAENVMCVSERLKKEEIRDTNIGLFGDNSYNWLVLFAAVIDSGNIAVALDKDMMADEISEILERLDVRILFADRKNIYKLAGISSSVKIESLEEVTACKDVVRTIRFSEPDKDATACIFLTSGTTGTRKGVMLSNDNIAFDINQTCKLFEVKGVSLAVLPFHHAFGLVAAIWMVFNLGHTIYISQGLRRLQKELVLVKPQTLMLVPLFVENFYKQILINANSSGRIKKMKVAESAVDLLSHLGIDVRKKMFKNIIDSFGGELDFIVSGGAALDPFYIKQFRRYGIEAINGYGTTECSPVAAVNRNYCHKDGTVGLPISDSNVIVDESGEILISGRHVMQGYYKEEEETEKVLQSGIYHTGDLGYVDKDGFLVLTGRKKNLIILSSGENISPEELEEKLLRIDDIDEVIVSAEQNHLKATIYSQKNDEDTYDSISSSIEHLNKTLPIYKRITSYTFQKEPFKKTTTQKIIRR